MKSKEKEDEIELRVSLYSLQYGFENRCISAGLEPVLSLLSAYCPRKAVYNTI